VAGDPDRFHDGDIPIGGAEQCSTREVLLAVFGLPGDRETSKCDSPQGSLTGVRFTIVRGKITVWKQVWWKAPGRAAIRASGR